jgi:hypothetical protein
MDGALDYLLHLTMVNIACFTGFLLFPVAGPLFFCPEKYVVPLHGGVFAWCGQWMHNNVHYPGGSLPSPHCAATTIMIVMLYRHNRRMFVALLPILITIYAATVYGRFHYVWDGLAAICAAALIIRCGPVIARFVTAAVGQAEGTIVRRPEPIAQPEEQKGVLS